MNISEILEQFDLLEDYPLARETTKSSQDKVLSGYNRYYNPDMDHVGAGYFAGHKITSAIGKRSPRMHCGLDLAYNLNQPVMAFCGGKVIIAHFENAYGNVVYVTDANRYWHVYAHLNEIKVKVGQAVKTGDIIGLAGNTGQSKGVHLHYAIWRPTSGRYENERAIDPRIYQYP